MDAKARAHAVGVGLLLPHHRRTVEVAARACVKARVVVNISRDKGSSISPRHQGIVRKRQGVCGETRGVVNVLLHEGDKEDSMRLGSEVSLLQRKPRRRMRRNEGWDETCYEVPKQLNFQRKSLRRTCQTDGR